MKSILFIKSLVDGNPSKKAMEVEKGNAEKLFISKTSSWFLSSLCPCLLAQAQENASLNCCYFCGLDPLCFSDTGRKVQKRAVTLKNPRSRGLFNLILACVFLPISQKTPKNVPFLITSIMLKWTELWNWKNGITSCFVVLEFSTELLHHVPLHGSD